MEWSEPTLPGFLVIYDNENEMINVDSWISVILSVKDLEPKWVYIFS
jgi:hypothetical protein